MTKDKLKSALKYVLPLLLALGVSYGYVDQSCVCSAPEVLPAPPVVEVEAADAGVCVEAANDSAVCE